MWVREGVSAMGCVPWKQVLRWSKTSKTSSREKGWGVRVGRKQDWGGLQIMMQVCQDLCTPNGRSRANIDHQRNLQWAEMDRCLYLHVVQSLVANHSNTEALAPWSWGKFWRNQRRGAVCYPLLPCTWAEMYLLRKDGQHISVSTTVHLYTPSISFSACFGSISSGILVDLFS